MKEVCKTCSGLGWVSNPSSPGEFNPLDCPDCKGSGIVNETDRVEQDGKEAPSLTKIEEKAGQR